MVSKLHHNAVISSNTLYLFLFPESLFLNTNPNCPCLKSIFRSEDGTSFHIQNVQVLSSKVLPQYFKHDRFTSFVRQLNFYSFRKEKHDVVRVADCNDDDGKRWHFRHEYFIRGKPELLTKIVRRTPNNSNVANKSISKATNSTKSNDSNINTISEQEKIENQQNRKEVQSLKSEIASLGSTLNLMESNINQLTKTLNMKLNINNHGQAIKIPNESHDSSVKDIPAIHQLRKECNEMSRDSNPKTPMFNTHSKQCDSPQTPSSSKKSTDQMKLATSPSTVIQSTEESLIQSKKILQDTYHNASSDLPDLAMATDEDFQMKDLSTTLIRSFSMTRSLYESKRDLHEPNISRSVVEIDDDDIYPSIDNTNLNSSIEEMDIQETMLPAFMPPMKLEERQRQDNKRIQSQLSQSNLNQLLQNLSTSQRNQFVNKVLTDLTDAVPVNTIYEQGSLHTNDIIEALERMLSLKSNNKVSDKNKKPSPAVQIEF